MLATNYVKQGGVIPAIWSFRKAIALAALPFIKPAFAQCQH